MEVFVRTFPNADEGKVQISHAGGTGPLWSRDGREIYFRRPAGEMVAVPITLEPSLRAGDP